MKNPYISKRKAALLFVQLVEADSIERFFCLVERMDIPEAIWDELVDYLFRNFQTEIYEIAKKLTYFVPHVSPQMSKRICEALISRGAVRSARVAKEKSHEGMSTEEICMLTTAVIAHHREDELEALLSEIRTMSLKDFVIARQLGELLSPVFCTGGKKLNVIARIGVTIGMS